MRARLAALASVPPEDLREALVTEYPPGAGIGWHRDAPPFGMVAAVSLAGPARTRWQHHIPPTKALRYSVTFRTLRKRPA